MRQIRYAFFALVFTIQAYAVFNLSWGLPAVSLDSNPPPGDADYNPKIAADPFGNAVATWSRSIGTSASEDVWASKYCHGARTWVGGAKISTRDNASNSTVAIDSEGNATLVWEEGFPSQIVSRTLNANGSWNPPLELPPLLLQKSAYTQTAPRLSVNPKGNALVIWVEIRGDIHRVCSAEKQLGEGWSALGYISSASSCADLPKLNGLALNKEGIGIAVWKEINQGSLQAARYINGKWEQEWTVSEASGQPIEDPCAGIDAQGNGVIVWDQGHTILSRRFSSSSLDPTFLTVSHPSFLAGHPCVALDASGNAIAVFERYDALQGGSPQNQFIAEARLALGADHWSSPTDISGPNSQGKILPGVGYPVVTLNEIGDGVAIWKEYNGKNVVIQGAGFSLGTWSIVRTLSSVEKTAWISATSHNLGVSLNLAGNVMAIWPEDVSRMNTPQIKAAPGIGIAIFGPLPPLLAKNTQSGDFISVGGVGTGKQVLHRYPAHGDLVNILSWSSPEGGVDHYRVYRGDFHTLVGTSETPSFEDHQRTKGKPEIYLITSMDSEGQESSPITILVKPR